MNNRRRWLPQRRRWSRRWRRRKEQRQRWSRRRRRRQRRQLRAHDPKLASSALAEFNFPTSPFQPVSFSVTRLGYYLTFGCDQSGLLFAIRVTFERNFCFKFFAEIVQYLEASAVYSGNFWSTFGHIWQLFGHFWATVCNNFDALNVQQKGVSYRQMRNKERECPNFWH